MSVYEIFVKSNNRICYFHVYLNSYYFVNYTNNKRILENNIHNNLKLLNIVLKTNIKA